jgi:hypothetical protein
MAKISYTILDGACVNAMSVNDFEQVAGYIQDNTGHFDGFLTGYYEDSRGHYHGFVAATARHSTLSNFKDSKKDRGPHA